MGETPRTIEPAGGLDELKALLFQGEARRLAEVESGVSRLDARVGDAPRLEQATAEILVEALRKAEVDRHRELADAIAPVVVASLRTEMKNSREMMVEMLYPLTGQLVVAAVQNAFRELMASLNQRLEALTSTDRYKLMIKSKLTGKPVSELALAQSTRGKITRALFLETGSGRLISSWRADGQQDERADMVGGLIAAITGFARDALDAGANELRTLDFGGRKILLRNSAQTIVAAECDGDLAHEQVLASESAFVDLVAANARKEGAGEGDLAAFAARINQAAAETKKGSGWPLQVAVGLLAIALLFTGWRAAGRWWIEKAVDRAIALELDKRPHLGSLPIDARVLHRDKRIELRGILPSDADAQALVSAVKAPAGDYAVEPRFTFLASSASFEALRREVAAQRETIEANARAAATTAQASQLAANLDALGARADALANDVATKQQVEEQRARVETLTREAATTTQLSEARARIEEITRSLAQLDALRSRVEALAGEAATKQQLEDQRGRLAALSQEAARATQIGDLQARLEALTRGGATSAQLAELRGRVDELNAASAGGIKQIEESLSGLTKRFGELSARLDTPRARLASLVDGFAIFFTEANAPLVPEAIGQRLDAIAEILKQNGLGLRVLGHSDAAGSANGNQTISRTRAEAVVNMLVARGVDRGRLVIVARASSQPIYAQDSGLRERNRRVTMEPLLESEETP